VAATALSSAAIAAMSFTRRAGSSLIMPCSAHSKSLCKVPLPSRIQAALRLRSMP
jgi:hypothetical protein